MRRGARARETPLRIRPAPCGRPAAGVLLFALAALGACNGLPIVEGQETDETASELFEQREEVRRSVDRFVDRFSAAVQSRANAIAEDAEDPQTVRRSIIWKLRVISACRSAAYQENPVSSLLDTWSVVLQMRLYFEEGEGRDVFAEHQESVVELCHDLEDELLRIARSLLPSDQVERIQQSLVERARDDPLQGSLMRGATALPAIAEDPEQEDVLTRLINLPFSTIGRATGVSDTARAVESASDALDRATRVIRHLPEETRWQTELLVHDLQRQAVVLAATSGFEKVAEGIERAARTLDELPAELGERLDATLSEERLASLRETTEEARATVEAAEQALEQMRDAGAAWQEAFGALERLTGTAAERAAGEGEEHEQEDGAVETLAAVESSARELRLLGLELDRLLEEGRLEAALERGDAAAGAVLARATALLLRLTLAVAGLLVLFFLLLGGYRVVRRRREERGRRSGESA